jgi:D-3-phosphoglycerate dehydrogenase / 2-oxoglutarate reductase
LQDYIRNIAMKNNSSPKGIHSEKVLIAAPVHPVLTDGLKELGYDCVNHENITQAAAFALIKDCIGVITSTRLQLDKPLIDAAPDLRWIGRMGSGMEVIDTAYAAKKNIVCFASPEGNCNAVGEHALGMLLTLTRRIAWSQSEISRGLWLREENRGIELEGKNVGIIGYGYTGAAFAKKLRGFDVRILAYDKYCEDGIPPDIVKCTSLELLMREADIVSFHVPLQADTRNYLSESFIERMAKPFILINTSRGGVVDTAALQRGIAKGKVIGACLDVLEQEPLASMDAPMRRLLDDLIRLPNIVVTPHIAGYTFEALYKMSKALLNKIIYYTSS